MDDADLAMVLERLRPILEGQTGKLRASDALQLAGFKSPSYHRSQIVAHALRDLGWERGRFRFKGVLSYAYARGTQLEREIMLDVQKTKNGFVLNRREP